jgi:hypothetical protein
MESEHLDRQPPRDEAEEAEQDRLIDTSGEGVDESLATPAPDPDIADE